MISPKYYNRFRLRPATGSAYLRFIILLNVLAFSLRVVGDENQFPVPAGLYELPVPEDNPLSTGKVALGKQLFFDTRLSRDRTISCATCHDPAQGWSNGKRFAKGADGQTGKRHVPTLINVGYQVHFFWDGRAPSLEAQVRQPIENSHEMGFEIQQLAVRLNEIEGYRQQFEENFGNGATPETIAKALASFVRTIVSGDAPFDRFRAGDLKALSPAARRGHDVFFFKASCAFCHVGPNLADNKFHNTGIGMDASEVDVGRLEQTKEEHDRGAFKTPTLREIARTAPYMHDGSLATLKDVVDFYAHGGFQNPSQDGIINVLPLSDEEKADLVVFLKEGLTSESYPKVEGPELPE